MQIKELPQLPDEYYTTEDNAEEDYESDFQSLTKTKRKVNNSFCLNNVTALDIKGFPEGEPEIFTNDKEDFQAPKTSRDSNKKNKFTFFSQECSPSFIEISNSKTK